MTTDYFIFHTVIFTIHDAFTAFFTYETEIKQIFMSNARLFERIELSGSR